MYKETTKVLYTNYYLKMYNVSIKLHKYLPGVLLFMMKKNKLKKNSVRRQKQRN